VLAQVRRVRAAPWFFEVDVRRVFSSARPTKFNGIRLGYSTPIFWPRGRRAWAGPAAGAAGAGAGGGLRVGGGAGAAADGPRRPRPPGADGVAAGAPRGRGHVFRPWRRRAALAAAARRIICAIGTFPTLCRLPRLPHRHRSPQHRGDRWNRSPGCRLLVHAAKIRLPLLTERAPSSFSKLQNGHLP